MLSIVIPAYNESKTLYHNICEIMNHIKQYDYEMIIVDDGSKDDTWNIITSLSSEYNKIKGLRFSRNFGKEAALFAGVSESIRRCCNYDGFRFTTSTKIYKRFGR